MTLLFCFLKYGRSIDKLSFIDVDAAAHCYYAKDVALNHTFSINKYFTSLTTGMIMRVQLELTGCSTFDLYRSFLICETMYFMLAAGLFWALLRERCEDGKWRLFVSLVLLPFYWAGYPAYSTMQGYSYLGVGTSLINLELILLDQFCRRKTYRFVSILGLNLALYGVFVSYTLFVPTAFIGAFIVIAIQMMKEEGGIIRNLIGWRNACVMLAVFLLPSVLGMLYSAGDMNEVTPGQGITLEGGGYKDIYSNFILPLPFIMIVIFCLFKRKDGRFILPLLAVHVVLMVILFIGLLQNKVSVYYYVKNNNVLWLLVWVVVAEAIWGMMGRTKWAALLPLYFYIVLGCGMFVDPWLNENKKIIPKVQYSVDLHMSNWNWFMHPADTNYDKMALFRYAYEHYDIDEVMNVNYPLENKWFSALTGGQNFFYVGTYEDFLQRLEDNNIRYIVGEYCERYSQFEPYFDTLEVITENSRGKIFKIPENSRPTVDAPALQ